MKKIGLYIHIPFCKSKCAYCAFTSFHMSECVQKKYVDALIKEIELTLSHDYVVDTLYFGGGTPSLLDASYIANIVDAVKKNSTYSPREVTIECNPESVDRTKLEVYKSIGINRISMGVQSLNDDILRLIGRIHNSNEAIEKAKLIKEYGFNLSVDMIIGLPNSNSSDIARFIDTFSRIGVNHISAYSLSVEPGTRLARMVDDGKITLLSEDAAVDEYDYAYELLKKNGYNRYEVSNFAKAGYESQHNNKYWLMDDYIGLGISSHSLINGNRYYNTDNINEYIDDMNSGKLVHIEEEVLTRKDVIEETIMLGLRLEQGVSIEKLNELLGKSFLDEYKYNIAKVKDYIIIDNGYMRIKSKYMNVMNAIIVDILS